MSKLVDKERLAQLAQALDQRSKAAVEAEKQRASAAESRIEGKADANAEAITAINDGSTGILAQAKKYADGKIDEVNSANSELSGKVTALESTVGNVGTGLVKDVADLQAKDSQLEGSIATNTAAIAKLNGGEMEQGSVAKTVKDAVEPVKTDVAELKAAVGVEGEGSTATGLYKKIADEDAKTLEAAKSYADQQITALVDGAPEAMDTLKELAQAIEDHENVYDAYVAQVSADLAKKVDKVEGSRLITEIEAAQYAAKAETSYVDAAKAEANSYTDGKILEVNGANAELSGKVTALESTVGNVGAGLVKDVNDLKAKDAELEGKISTAQQKAEQADANATAVGVRVDTLESTVGSSASGLVKDVADHKKAIDAINDEFTGVLAQAKAFTTDETGKVDAKVNVVNGKVTALESTVGNGEGGLVKDVKDLKTKEGQLENSIAANTSAIATLNGGVGVTGSVDKKINDALATYSTTEEVKGILSNIVNSLALTISGDKIKLNLGGVEGVTLTETTLDLATSSDIEAIIAGLDAPGF